MLCLTFVCVTWIKTMQVSCKLTVQVEVMVLYSIPTIFLGKPTLTVIFVIIFISNNRLKINYKQMAYISTMKT